MDFGFRRMVWIIEDSYRSSDCLWIPLKGMILKVYQFLLLGPKLDGHDATREETVTCPCWSNLIDVTDTSFRGCCFSEKRSCAKHRNQPCQEDRRAPHEHCSKSDY